MSVEVSTQAWKTKTNSSSQKLVLLALADHSDADGYSFPGVNSIANKTGLDRRTVQRAIAHFKAEGILQTEERREQDGRQRSNYYRLTLQGGRQDAAGGRQQTAPEGGDMPPLEPSQEPSNKQTPRERQLLVSGVDYSGLRAVVSQGPMLDYLEYRKKIKKNPVATQTQVNRMVKELHKCIEQGWTGDDVIEESMAAGWLGFKAEWLQKRVNGYGGKAYQQGNRGAEPASERAAREEAEYLARFRHDGGPEPGHGETLDPDDPNLR